MRVLAEDLAILVLFNFATLAVFSFFFFLFLCVKNLQLKMTVVERRERTGSRDQFPVGMRVLAVDDDPTCLKVLESLLLRCQYHG